MVNELSMSFDIVSLFTCVPVDQAVEIAQRRLDNDEILPDRTSLNVQEVDRLLHVSFFLNVAWMQRTYHLEESSTSRCVWYGNGIASFSYGCHVIWWWKMWKRGPWPQQASSLNSGRGMWMIPLPPDQCEAFHAHVNSVEQSTQFTVEKESDGKLPFLDLLLKQRLDGSISTSVFRKSTHTDRYLDFDSHHPLTHKTAVVRTLQYRTRMLS